MAHAYNPSTLGGPGKQITWGWEFKTSLANMVKPHLYYKYKISWAWWCMSVIPATREAEAGESLEPRRWKLQWTEIAPLHPSLGNKSKTPSQKKKKTAKSDRPKCQWPIGTLSPHLWSVDFYKIASENSLAASTRVKIWIPCDPAVALMHMLQKCVLLCTRTHEQEDW